ncbi:MAG: asparagine synthase-related protein [Halodesulfurarchaeum sp.]
MPGLSLLRTPDTESHRTFEALLDELLYRSDYSKRHLFSTEDLRLDSTDYPSYPIETFENDSFFVALEGRLYATEDVEGALFDVATWLHSGNDERIRRWLLDRDAEFVLVVVDKETADVVVLTDILGRLPVYLFREDETVLVSRELGSVLDFTTPTMDSMGVAQMLLFGYPLGERTLYDGIHQLEPASVIQLSRGSVSVEQIHQYRFDRTERDDRSVSENAAVLTDRFVDACANRSTGGTNVVSLSGGLDSRAIASCYAKNDLPFVAATYARENEESEADIARAVMDELDAPWDVYELSPPTGAEVRTLLDMKRGMNYLGMAYILEFFSRLRSDYGSDMTYVTGDGGDKIFPAHSRGFTSVDEVVSYLLKDASRFDVETVAGLTDVPEEAIVDEMYRTIEDYPGSDPDHLYTLFLFRERGAKWLFHGEDRNRYYFWSVAPFWSWPMVEYAMEVPDDQKRRERLYETFIRSFSDSVVDIEYANFGASLGSIEYDVKRGAYDFLGRYPAVRDAVISLVRSGRTNEYDPTVATVLQRQATSNGIGEVLSHEAVSTIASDRTSCNSTQAYNLLTVTTAVEAVYGRSTLDAFEEYSFG